MKRNRIRYQVVLTIVLLVFIACKSVKPSQEQVSTKEQVTETTGMCEQTIKYYIDKFVMIKDGQEINVPTVIVVHPKAKFIGLTSEPPNQGKVSFDTEIESYDCDFNKDLTQGQTIYRGYIKQEDGTRTTAVLKFEAKGGELTISNGDPNVPVDYIMRVTKWEIINE